MTETIDIGLHDDAGVAEALLVALLCGLDRYALAHLPSQVGENIEHMPIALGGGFIYGNPTPARRQLVKRMCADLALASQVEFGTDENERERL